MSEKLNPSVAVETTRLINTDCAEKQPNHLFTQPPFETAVRGYLYQY
jgi:hypothetical protein